MRRLGTTKTIKRILICIVVGLITSVGVAWLAVASEDNRIITHGWTNARWISSHQYSIPEDSRDWQYGRTEGITWVRVYGLIVEPNPELPAIRRTWWNGIRFSPNIDHLLSEDTFLEDAWGFPMVCMYSTWRRSEKTNTSKHHFGLEIYNPIVGSHIYPVRPIWLGLFVNTSLYALVTWLVILSYFGLRYIYRLKLGYCKHCDYNVCDLTMCPECGSDVEVIDSNKVQWNLSTNNTLIILAIYILPHAYILSYFIVVRDWSWIGGAKLCMTISSGPASLFNIQNDGIVQSEGIAPVLLFYVIQWSLILYVVCITRLQKMPYWLHIIFSLSWPLTGYCLLRLVGYPYF